MSGLDRFFESRGSNKQFKLIKEENSYLDSLKELHGTDPKQEVLNENAPAPFLQPKELPTAKVGPRTHGGAIDVDLLKQKARKQMSEFFEIPVGSELNHLGLDHFKGLIQKRGWPKISEALSILVKHSKNSNHELYEWADDMKERCDSWVKRQEKLQS